MELVLAGMLEGLLSWSIERNQDLSIWYAKANEAENFAASNQIELPEIVSHYLSDADIRLKDFDYGKHQIEAVKEFIGNLTKSRNA